MLAPSPKLTPAGTWLKVAAISDLKVELLQGAVRITPPTAVKKVCGRGCWQPPQAGYLTRHSAMDDSIGGS